MNQLKEAEKNATKLVQDARRARVDRMKEAKHEAEQAIAAYRAEMEASYQSSLARQAGQHGSAGSALEAETARDISSMTREFNDRKEGVSQMLVDWVTSVEIRPPAARV